MRGSVKVNTKDKKGNQGVKDLVAFFHAVPDFMSCHETDFFACR
jgi:hypothetical protein